MAYEWDEKKNEANRNKHGIDFSEATLIFNAPVLEKIDNRRDYGEERWVALGATGNDILFVAFTWRRGKRRIISARRARRDERKAYRAVHQG
jgi:hypothetical protein